MSTPGPSRVELFLDFRPLGQGLHDPQYNPSVHQIFLPPLRDAEQKPVARVHTAGNYSESSQSLDGATIKASTVENNSYWVAYRVPWSKVQAEGRPGEMIGFDVAVNGSNGNKKQPGTKSQLILFGTTMNYRNASGFATAILAKKK